MKFLRNILLITLFANISLEGASIRQIFVQGNKKIKKDVILNRIPYKIGEDFDAEKSQDAINSLFSLGYFRQISVEAEEIDKDNVDLYIIVEEKKLLEKIEFKENKHIKSKKFLEDLMFSKIETIDQELLERSAQLIVKKYKEEGYNFTQVTSKLIAGKTPDKVIAQFTIVEGPKSIISRVNFIGNKKIPSRKLAQIIFSRERWLLSFLDEAGKFTQDALSLDKQRLEHFYRDFGYLNAKVTDAKAEFSKDKKNIELTFTVEEGNEYFVRTISAPGDDEFIERDLLPCILLEQEKPYSVSKVGQSMEKIRALYGDKGYIYADVYPQVVPDETTNTVDITFFVEKGKKIFVNHIDITGNNFTQDKVIRRKIDLGEGDLITSKKLDESRDSVEALSFFERGQVNWRMHRISDDLADLEMNVKEAKAGRLNFNLSYGSSENSNKRALKLGVQLAKDNFLGRGTSIGLQVQSQLKKHGSQFFEAHYIDPNLFDTDLLSKIAAYHRRQQFDEWVDLTSTPAIYETGGVLGFGLPLKQWDKNLILQVDSGIEYLNTNKLIADPTLPARERRSLQGLVDNLFAKSLLQTFDVTLYKDTRNHHIYPSKGYKIDLSSKIAFPFLNDQYGFIKFELDASYYTRLIGTDTLVLLLHGKAGTNFELGDKNIPYKELYHIGGQNTVRGFKWGEIGPAFLGRDPIGGKSCLQFNSELIFPILPDYSVKGHFFYDAGAGWDAPKKGAGNNNFITRDNFVLRHSVGFGFNILRPMPIKVDWGYKLDRNKRAGESPHEFHLGMNMAF